jgi:type IV pilus assembly protein PilA
MRSHRSGFTLIELIICCAIIAILSAVAYGFMSQQMMLAHETAAMEEIKTLHTAEAQYFAQFGKYAGNLTSLAGLIPQNLASGKKSGYLVELAETPDGYAVSAVPQKPGSSGRRSFYSDQTLVIRTSWTTEPANANSAAIE